MKFIVVFLLVLACQFLAGQQPGLQVQNRNNRKSGQC